MGCKKHYMEIVLYSALNSSAILPLEVVDSGIFSGKYGN